MGLVPVAKEETGPPAPVKFGLSCVRFGLVWVKFCHLQLLVVFFELDYTSFDGIRM